MKLLLSLTLFMISISSFANGYCHGEDIKNQEKRQMILKERGLAKSDRTKLLEMNSKEFKAITIGCGQGEYCSDERYCNRGIRNIAKNFCHKEIETIAEDRTVIENMKSLNLEQKSRFLEMNDYTKRVTLTMQGFYCN